MLRQKRLRRLLRRKRSAPSNNSRWSRFPRNAEQVQSPLLLMPPHRHYRPTHACIARDPSIDQSTGVRRESKMPAQEHKCSQSATSSPRPQSAPRCWAPENPQGFSGVVVFLVSSVLVTVPSGALVTVCSFDLTVPSLLTLLLSV
jgi:hypothetical protein